MGKNSAEPQDTLEATGPTLAPPARTDDLPDGSSLGDYLILGRLGRGGMGTVYRARHQTLERLSALKVLDAAGVGGGARFLREARSAAKLDHHNIVSVHHAGQAEGHWFLEMELVEGRSLGQLITAGPVAPALALRCIEQVAHALQHAHSRGIIHRDIKPDNILISDDEIAKVTDFGLAKQTLLETSLTAPGSILGTPAYMAPEQWQGSGADARTDLYQLGATLFHLLAGRPPFRGKLADLLRQHLESPVPRLEEVDPGLPPELPEIVQRLMAKKPEDRYQSAAELIGDLRRAQQPAPAAGAPPAIGTASSAAPPTVAEVAAPELAPGWSLRRRLLVALTLWLGLAGLLIAGEQAALWQGAERRLEDARMVARDPVPRFGGVQLLLADDELAQRSGLPFDRASLADVVDALKGAGARAIALDLLIADPGPAINDDSLVQSTRAAPALIHAMDLFPGKTHQQGPPASLPARFALKLSPERLERAERAVLPIPELLQAAHHLGTVGVPVDSDGVVRRMPLLVSYAGKVYPSLALMAACLVQGAELEQVQWTPGQPITISAPGRPPLRIPVDDRAALRLSVRGDLEGRAPVSLLRVLELARAGTREADRQLRQLVEGKLVLVGVSATGLADIQPLPGLPAPPLVLAHAFAAETMLGSDFVGDLGLTGRVLLILLLSLVGLAAGLWLRHWLAAPALLLGALLLWLGAGHLLEARGLLLPQLTPLFALFAGGLVGGLHRAGEAQLQRRRLLDALGRYLPRRVAQRVLADPKAMRLGGQRKELTLLSVELQGFAALSERLEPEEVGQLLARVFAVVTARVQQQEGTLDRFSGEGVRAFFGDPLPLPDHATRAVSCALAIRDDCLRVLASWAAEGRPRPVLGIGLHTGYVTVGNIGTLQRMEYTVLGRNLEIAHRLASTARDSVLVSGRTRSAAGDAFLYERRAPLREDREHEVHEVCSPR